MKFPRLPHDQNMVDLWHYSCGIALCLIPIALIRVGGNSGEKMCLDSYTFPIYITHHIYLVGPLSLASVFGSPWIVVPVSLILIVLSSFILKTISDYVIKQIKI